MAIDCSVYPRISPHVIFRSRGRLGDYITEDDLLKASKAAERYQKEDKVYALLRKFGKPIDTIYEGTYDINGDSLVAVIRNGAVVTIMIGWANRSNYYRRDSRLGLVSI